MHWRQQGELWVLAPQRPDPIGLIDFIGGSYLAATPQLSYRRLLEGLADAGWLIHAWSYVPGFDHQSQANAAWRCFREAHQALLGRPGTAANVPSLRLRLGHSLGCKLHLLAPDGGRNCDGVAALAFNNFSAERSVPLLAELGQPLGFRTEFSPSPRETLLQVQRSYRQPRTLVVRFQRDSLDQSERLLAALRARDQDRSELLSLPGDHLSPASAGLRRTLIGSWADDPARARQISTIAGQLSAWGESLDPAG